MTDIKEKTPEELFQEKQEVIKDALHWAWLDFGDW
jgi:hypothetical protein